ncbi:SIMPL domain-containing protein [Caulobacter sp. UNC358MFTsu5.1]|uniref:SIMPL domain-containing protein n=1 Tax=Caulobacter sp. UNC358MFTsu5.1 TaxID=1449049 RepID=UPI0004A6D72B|nr:SIMPL domain-containing protein [Caulobacter sp. UNC358MFTsu5.1]
MRLLLVAALACVPASAVLAQTPEPTGPTVTVIGNGRAEAPADYAWLSFNLRGEGPSSPDAVSALSTTRGKLEASLAALASKPTLDVRSSTLSIREVRPKACNATSYGAPSLSTGECAVIGSVATVGFQVKVTPAKQVGDVASLAAQLGGSDINVSNGGLIDDQPLEDKAMRSAIADAKRQAQLIAESSGGKLGPLVRIQDSQAVNIGAFGAPPPPPPPPPARAEIVVTASKLAAPLTMAPPPITRTARVTAVYSLLP